VHAVERIACRVVAADLEPQHLLPVLDTLPKRIIDDTQVRYLSDFPLLARIGTRDALTSAGILDVAATVRRLVKSVRQRRSTEIRYSQTDVLTPLLLRRLRLI
jgi:hypothetical protein